MRTYWIIEFILVKILLIVACFLCGSALARNPNPCEGVPGSDQFRNDWSSCRFYFWCNNGQAIPTFPCPEGFGFDEEEQLCTNAAAQCDECPQDINIAVSLERVFKRKNTLWVSTCTGGRSWWCGVQRSFPLRSGWKNHRTHYMCRDSQIQQNNRLTNLKTI